jgi:hypothetical protein
VDVFECQSPAGKKKKTRSSEVRSWSLFPPCHTVATSRIANL